MAKLIMTADDSASVRQMVSFTLKQNGYDVVEAVDGKDALTKLGSQKVDMLITDLNMPNLDGIRLTQQLRDSDEFKYIPLILVTSLESAADRERGMRAGANAYIVKRGFNQAELLSTIRQLI